MVRVPSQQFDFTGGWMDAGMAARRDLDRYYKGGQELRNVVLETIGGAASRGGLRYRAEIPDAAAGVKIEGFEFSTEQLYLTVFTDANLRVFMDGAEVWTGAAPWTAAQLADMDRAQALDTMILTHSAHQTRELKRTASHTSWALDAVAFTRVPTHPMGRETTSSGTPTAATGTGVTFTAAASEFTAGDVGKWIVGNQGRAKIAGYTSATVVTVDIDQDFKDTTAIHDGDWTIETEVWSAAEGWPAAVHLQEGRSFMAGSSTLLQTAWGSRSGAVYDFKVTWEALDDEAAEATLAGKRVNAIRRIDGNVDLFLFTSGGIFAVSPGKGAAITPETFLPKKHVAIPSANLQPVDIDGAVGFVAADDDGNPTTLHELVHDPNSATERYMALDLNVVSASLARKPIGLAARKGKQSAMTAVQVFMVNGDDGTVAVLHSRRNENVAGWALWDSPGNSGSDAVLAVAVVGSEVYFVVERTVDGAARYFLESLDDGLKFDCAVTAASGAAQSEWAALAPHLEGETVKVFADGALRDDAVVGVGGAVAVSDGGEALAVSDIEIGLAFRRVVETMPLEAQLSNGTAVGEANRLFKATIEVANAYPGFTVNDRPGTARRFGASVLDAAPAPFTGLVTRRFLGWRKNRARGATVRVESAMPLTVRSVKAVLAG